MNSRLTIADTTLRDGIQMPGVRICGEGKVEIARALEAAGVRSLEIGFPAAGPAEIRDMRAIGQAVRRSMLLALCRPLQHDIEAARLAFDSIPRVRCGVNLFLATSPLHRESKLKMTRRRVLEVAAAGISYARRYFTAVSFSAEDASHTEFDFLCEVYRTAIDAGATTIGFPDTLGVLTPEASFEVVSDLRRNLETGDARLAVHFHNDLGLATANSLAAIRAGADVVQCTVNGIGERAGNASLEEVAVALSLNPQAYGRKTTIDTARLTALSRLVAEHTGIEIPANKSIVGRNAFCTAAGLHQDGILKDARTYLPFSPRIVGVDAVTFELGQYSGRAAAASYLASAGHASTPEAVESLLNELKTRDSTEVPRRVAIHVS